MYKEKQDVLDEMMKKMDECGMEKFGAGSR